MVYCVATRIEATIGGAGCWLRGWGTVIQKERVRKEATRTNIIIILQSIRLKAVVCNCDFMEFHFDLHNRMEWRMTRQFHQFVFNSILIVAIPRKRILHGTVSCRNLDVSLIRCPNPLCSPSRISQPTYDMYYLPFHLFLQKLETTYCAIKSCEKMTLFRNSLLAIY